MIACRNGAKKVYTKTKEGKEFYQNKGYKIISKTGREFLMEKIIGR